MKEDLCDYYKLKIRNNLREQRLDVFIAYLKSIDKRFYDFDYDKTSSYSKFDTLFIYEKKIISHHSIAEIRLFYKNQETIKENEKERRHKIIVYDREYYNTLKKFGEVFGFEKILKCWNGCENEI